MTRVAALVLPLVFLAGCDLQTLYDRFTPKEDVEFAKRFLALFQAADFAAIEKSLDPSLAGPQLRPRLEQIARAFPKGAAKSVHVIGAQTHTFNDSTSVNLTLEYEYSDSWVIAAVFLQKTGQATTVRGVNVRQTAESLEHVNRFTFDGKGATHYAVLAATIAVPLFVLYTLVAAIRTPIPRRKWLWIVFVLLGIATLSLNWTTGDLNVALLSGQLFGAAFAKMGPAAPVVISVSIPLGAIVFWMRRRRWTARPTER